MHKRVGGWVGWVSELVAWVGWVGSLVGWMDGQLEMGLSSDRTVWSSHVHVQASHRTRQA